MSGQFRKIGLAALLGAVAACAAPPEINFRSDRAGAQVVPADHRGDTLSFMRSYLNNPTMVRDAAMTEPFLRHIAGRERYVACLRYNARDSAGRYTGASDRLAVFFEGRFDQLIERGGEFCAGASYAPFPDLERLTP